MPQELDTRRLEQALNHLVITAGEHRDAQTASGKKATRAALHKAVVAAVQAGARQAAVARVSGMSKAQVSRVSRGATSGKEPLPSAAYLVDTLPAADIINRYLAGENAVQLGRAYGCSGTTIIGVLKKNGVPRRPGRSIELPVAIEELAHRYLHDRAEIQDLAAELGVKPNLISRRLAQAGVVVPVGHRRMDLPDAEIVRRYKNREPVLRIARSYGVSSATIMYRVREDEARRSRRAP